MIMPPCAKRANVSRQAHGKSWTDPYAWLRDPKYPAVDDPDILDYLSKENSYFDRWTENNINEIKKIKAELKGRIKDDDHSVPVREGGFDYFWSFKSGAQYRCWYRRPKDNLEEKQIVLDETALANGNDYFNLRYLAYSSDAKLLAYSIDTIGDERYRIRAREIANQAELDFEIPNTSGSVVWDQTNRFLFYVELNDQLRPFCVRRFDRLNPRSAGEIVFKEQDPGFFVSIGPTSDRAYLGIYSGNHVTREVHVQPLTGSEIRLRCLSPRRSEHRYSLDHAHGWFYILTNDKHENFSLSRTSSSSSEAAWDEIIAGSDSIYLLEHQCFADFILLALRENGQSQLEVLSYEGERHRIDFGIDVFAASIGSNREFHSHSVRVAMSSPVTPATIFDYHTRNRELIIRKVQEIPSGFDGNQYRCERIWARADDGVEVPLTVVRHKSVKLYGSAPAMLYGYGSYGLGTEPGFNANRVSLLDRGVVCAIAHVRGGDELGHAWYRQGKLEKKRNTFRDFISCAEKLVANGYTRDGRIAIMGGSAGGMLVGAVINERPELWAAAVALVPFVDVLNTMLDDTLPLTPIEWPEWGNPNESSADFEIIQSYCPYSNVGKKPYPPLLVTAGISDPRVTYWEPAKWVAKLRHEGEPRGPIYLKTNMGAGHFGVSGRFDALSEMAQIYVFMLEHFDIGLGDGS